METESKKDVKDSLMKELQKLEAEFGHPVEELRVSCIFYPQCSCPVRKEISERTRVRRLMSKHVKMVRFKRLGKMGDAVGDVLDAFQDMQSEDLGVLSDFCASCLLRFEFDNKRVEKNEAKV